MVQGYGVVPRLRAAGGNRFLLKVMVPVTGCALLGGCASIRAEQKPVKSADIAVHFLCPDQAELTAFDNLSGRAKGQYRDRVVLGCVKAIEAHYADFKVAVRQESVSVNLLADVTSLGLTVAAPLAKAKAAKRMAAGAGFIIGSRAAFDKDVFYQQTLPAIIPAMDAQRYKILKTIVEGQKGDPDATKYGLLAAAIDLAALQSAGNIFNAISELTREANVAADTAKKQLDASKQGTVFDIGEPILLDSEVVKRINAMVVKLYGLKNPADRTKLDAAAKAMGVPMGGVFDDERAAVIVQINKQAQDPDIAKQINGTSQAEAALFPILGS